MSSFMATPRELWLPGPELGLEPGLGVGWRSAGTKHRVPALRAS